MKKQEKDLEKKIFDGMAQKGSYSEAPEKDYHILFKRLFSNIQLGCNMNVLDVGCGTGSNSIRLSKFDFKVTGVDISPRAIEIARKRVRQNKLKDIHFCVCDIENLCYDDNSFDICFCGAVLHHFPDLEKVAKELLRVTKINGAVFAYDPNALHPYVFMVHNVLNKAINLKGFSPNEKALKPKELYKAFNNAGFINIKFDSIVMHTTKNKWKFIRNISYAASSKVFSGLRRGNMIIMICQKVK